jgi:hypothetical protein
VYRAEGVRADGAAHLNTDRDAAGLRQAGQVSETATDPANATILALAGSVCWMKL